MCSASVFLSCSAHTVNHQFGSCCGSFCSLWVWWPWILSSRRCSICHRCSAPPLTVGRMTRNCCGGVWCHRWTWPAMFISSLIEKVLSDTRLRMWDNVVNLVITALPSFFITVEEKCRSQIKWNMFQFWPHYAFTELSLYRFSFTI